MSLGSPSVPSAPNAPSSLGGGTGQLLDPFNLASQQQAYNIAAGYTNQAASMPSIATPAYSQTFGQIGTGPGGVPLYGMVQGFSDPQAQANYTQYLQNQGQAGTQQFQNLTDTGNSLINASLTAYDPASYYLSAGAEQQYMAQQALNEADPFIRGGYSTIQNSAIPALDTAQQYGAMAIPAYATATGYGATGAQNLLGASNYLNQGGNYLNQFGNQNPNQIGDMSSGLTGQMMSSYMASQQPFQQTARDQLDNQLRNQGLAPGMPGYDNAMRSLDTSQNLSNYQAQAQFEPQAWQQATQIYQDPLAKAQAYQQQAGAGVGVGQAYTGLGGMQAGIGQGYTSLGGMQGGLGQAYTGAGASQMQGGNYLTNLGQAMSGIGAQYGALGNAQTGLAQALGNQGMGLTSQALPWLAASAPTMPPQPSFPGMNIQPANLGSYGTSYNQALNQDYQNQLAAYNAQLSQNQNMLSGLFGVGSSTLGALAAGGLFSERSLKENIEPLGKLPNGIPVYRFNYKWGGPTIVGPMADEVERVMPKAVSLIDGVKIVDYRMIAA